MLATSPGSAVRPRRTALYLPADNARAIEKARTADCDVVILDLEDMVAPDAKPQARTAAAEAVRIGGFGERELVIRANGLDTPWGTEDIALAASLETCTVLLPKISSAGELEQARTIAGNTSRLWTMIETCRAIMRLDQIGEASREMGVDAWVIGSSDLAKDMHCANDAERSGLIAALSMSIIGARAHGLAILDGVFTDLTDAAGLARQCAQAAALGFDGKTVVHPNQLAPANAAFTPDEASVTWAYAVVAAFNAESNRGQAVVKVEGRLVERPHLEYAMHLVRIAEAIAALNR